MHRQILKNERRALSEPPLAVVNGRHRPARLWDIFEDEHGLLWTVLIVADENFKVRPFEPYRVKEAHDPRYDTIIEVIDPTSGELVTSRRFDQAYSNLLEGPTVVGFDATPEGHQLITFTRLRLTGRSESR